MSDNVVELHPDSYDGLLCTACGCAWFYIVAGHIRDGELKFDGTVCVGKDMTISGYGGRLVCAACTTVVPHELEYT